MADAAKAANPFLSCVFAGLSSLHLIIYEEGESYFPNSQRSFLKTGVPLLRDIFASAAPVTVEIRKSEEEDSDDGYGYW